MSGAARSRNQAWQQPWSVADTPLAAGRSSAGVFSIDATGERIVGREGPSDLARFRKVIEINLIGSYSVLNLAANDIDAEGAKALAAALTDGRAVLTSLDVGGNGLNEEAALGIVRVENTSFEKCSVDYSADPICLTLTMVHTTGNGWEGADLTPAQVGRIREAFLPTLEKFYPEMLRETARFSGAA